MGVGLTKTLVCLLFIGIGLALKFIIKEKDQLSGIKIIILSLALPATIFIALLKIDIQIELIFLPILALLFNLILFGSTYVLLKLLNQKINSPRSRTILLLLGSMAPGLSCFPFIIEYLNEDALAFAAFADVGNKFYGLILLYLIAMHWHYRTLSNTNKNKENVKKKLQDLCTALIKEPINLVLIIGLIMLFYEF